MSTQVDEKRSSRSLAARVEAAVAGLRARAIGGREANPEGGERVCDVMSRRVVSIGTDEPVARAAERLAEGDVGVLAVCRSGGRLSGVITDRDSGAHRRAGRLLERIARRAGDRRSARWLLRQRNR